eukprot:scaffold77936_cov37-Attheya_sp.AAC.2
MAGGRRSVDTDKFFKFDDGVFNCSGSPFPADGKAWESEFEFVKEFQTCLSLLRKGVPLPVTMDENVASRIQRLHHLESLHRSDSNKGVDIPLKGVSAYTVSGTTYEVVPDVLAIIPIEELSDLRSVSIIELKKFASVSRNLSTRLPDIIEVFSSDSACTNIPLVTDEILEELEWIKSGLSRLNLANHGLDNAIENDTRLVYDEQKDKYYVQFIKTIPLDMLKNMSDIKNGGWVNPGSQEESTREKGGSPKSSDVKIRKKRKENDVRACRDSGMSSK